jgi:hypothetical protein
VFVARYWSEAAARVYNAVDRWVDAALRQDGSLVSPDRSDLRGNGTGELRNEMLDRSLRIEYLALAYDPEAVLDRVARLSAPSNAT